MGDDVTLVVRKQPGGGYVVDGYGSDNFPATAVTRFEEIAGVLRRAFGEPEPKPDLAEVLRRRGHPTPTQGDPLVPGAGYPPPIVLAGFVEPGAHVEWVTPSGDCLTGTVKRVERNNGLPHAVMENGMVAFLHTIRGIAKTEKRASA